MPLHRKYFCYFLNHQKQSRQHHPIRLRFAELPAADCGCLPGKKRGHHDQHDPQTGTGSRHRVGIGQRELYTTRLGASKRWRRYQCRSTAAAFRTCTATAPRLGVDAGLLALGTTCTPLRMDSGCVGARTSGLSLAPGWVGTPRAQLVLAWRLLGPLISVLRNNLRSIPRWSAGHTANALARLAYGH